MGICVAFNDQDAWVLQIVAIVSKVPTEPERYCALTKKAVPGDAAFAEVARFRDIDAILLTSFSREVVTTVSIDTLDDC